MSRNERPVFARAPVIDMATVSTANTNLDGSGTIVAVATGTAEGVRIELIEIKAIETTTAGMIRLFLSEDGGSTWELWKEVPVTAITIAANTAAFSAEEVPTEPLELPSTNHQLGASTHNAEEFNIFARGGSLAAD